MDTVTAPYSQDLYQLMFEKFPELKRKKKQGKTEKKIKKKISYNPIQTFVKEAESTSSPTFTKIVNNV